MLEGFEELQEMVLEDARKAYSAVVIDHAMKPRNMGEMANADSHVSVLGPCSDRMDIWIVIDNNRVREATFLTDGCMATVACGSMVTELAKDKTLGEALSITAEVIANNLGGLPDDHIHCAGLASLTLKKAIIEYMNIQKEPWKKAYRR